MILGEPLLLLLLSAPGCHVLTDFFRRPLVIHLIRRMGISDRLSGMGSLCVGRTRAAASVCRSVRRKLFRKVVVSLSLSVNGSEFKPRKRASGTAWSHLPCGHLLVINLGPIKVVFVFYGNERGASTAYLHKHHFCLFSLDNKGTPPFGTGEFPYSREHLITTHW